MNFKKEVEKRVKDIMVKRGFTIKGKTASFVLRNPNFIISPKTAFIVRNGGKSVDVKFKLGITTSEINMIIRKLYPYIGITFTFRSKDVRLFSNSNLDHFSFYSDTSDTNEQRYKQLEEEIDLCINHYNKQSETLTLKNLLEEFISKEPHNRVLEAVALAELGEKLKGYDILKKEFLEGFSNWPDIGPVGEAKKAFSDLIENYKKHYNL